jgi:hypothetical protein
MDCGMAIVESGADTTQDLKCFQKALEAIGTGSGQKGVGF